MFAVSTTKAGLAEVLPHVWQKYLHIRGNFGLSQQQRPRAETTYSHACLSSSSTMSDPPRPKPGSLRDRIAAFENKGPAQAAPAPPAPRPKPREWKPKPVAASPPGSPSATPDAAVTSSATPDEPHGARKVGGMSASDAKESIGMGGSLKERMAALKGMGAFGGAPPR